MQSKLKQGAGAIAQSVEQRTENPCVPGSIPGGTTNRNKVSEYMQVFRDLFFVFPISCKKDYLHICLHINRSTCKIVCMEHCPIIIKNHHRFDFLAVHLQCTRSCVYTITTDSMPQMEQNAACNATHLLFIQA